MQAARKEEARRAALMVFALKQKGIPGHVGQKVREGAGKRFYDDGNGNVNFEVNGRFATFRGEDIGRICLKKRTKIGQETQTVLKFQNVRPQVWQAGSNVTITRGNGSGSSHLEKVRYIDIDADTTIINIDARNGEHIYSSYRSEQCGRFHKYGRWGNLDGNGELKICLEMRRGETVQVAHESTV